MVEQRRLQLTSDGRGFLELTARIAGIVHETGIRQGLCHLFLQHTSASLCITENADRTVRGDLERWMQRQVTDGDPVFRHRAEGPDDMPGHVRNLLVGCELTVPVSEGQLALGTWQGIYLWEHRQAGHERQLVVTLVGTS